jgi:hypothetical protein
MQVFEKDEMQEVFSEGYREPGDDTVRLAYYVLLAAGFCGCGVGLVLEIYDYALTKHGLNGKLVGLDIALSLLCCLICGFVPPFFIKEAKHWDLKKLSADKVVAGGFLLGIALAYLGLRMGFGTRVEPNGELAERGLIALGGAGLGIAICLLSLVVGLIYAFGEKLHERPRKIKLLVIDRRYGLDANLVEHENHPCPREDGMTAMVICTAADGKKMRLVAGENAYDLADPGKKGSAVTRGSRLQEFHPNR